MNYYCTICKSYVTKTSKHCGSCDRCVNGFDHHCKWLNNCIGELNYKLFIFLISFLEINEIILLIFEVYTISLINYPTILSLLSVDIFLNSLIILLLGYLIGIHAVLKFKGMTTYEYIKAMRKKKENKIKPTVAEEKNNNASELKKKDTKKSIVKSVNKTVLENPFSFSIAKSVGEDVMHLTFQIRTDSEEDLKII